MAKRGTKHWNLYDWLDVAEREGLERCCPKCGDDRVTYSIYEVAGAGLMVRVHCSPCQHSDSGHNNSDDAERLVRDWHARPDAINTPLIAR